MIWINARSLISALPFFMWQPASMAPFDRDLELAVIDAKGPHALIFPCRRILSGWVKAETGERVVVDPTHWRDWKKS